MYEALCVTSHFDSWRPKHAAFVFTFQIKGEGAGSFTLLTDKENAFIVGKTYTLNLIAKEK